MKVLDSFKGKQEIISEKIKLRTENLNLRTKLDDMNGIYEKYIKLLEQKSEQFDLYFEYQSRCEELTNEKREMKKQLAEIKENCSSLEKTNADLVKENQKLEKKIKRLERENERNN